MNEVLFQGFHWFQPSLLTQVNNQRLWPFITAQADHLRSIGIDAIWLPPASRGMDNDSVGYDVYDHYNVGEFPLNNRVETKYGTKAQLRQAIDALHGNGNDKRIQVYADIVLNHRAGGKASGYWQAVRVEKEHRHIRRYGEGFERGIIEIKAYTNFDFPERAGKYSSFQWSSRHFDSVDTVDDIREGDKHYKDDHPYIYLFLYNEQDHVPHEKDFDRWVDLEKENFDFLTSSDFDYGRPDVRQEMMNWGEWFVKEFGFDGLRFDAVKHVSRHYIQQWLGHVRWKTGKNLFAVAEYISGSTSVLHEYIHDVTTQWEFPQRITLFDFPLFFQFNRAGFEGEAYDLAHLFKNNLVSEQPALAVTFVENHDYEYGRGMDCHVQAWFKPIAYAFILLRAGGYPCIFFPDYYGSVTSGHHQSYHAGSEYIELLIRLRKQFSLGEELSYSNGSVAGWTRLGFVPGAKGAMAVVINTSYNRVRAIHMHTRRNNRRFYHAATIRWTAGGFIVVKGTYEMYGDKKNELWTNAEGAADFIADGGSVAIWLEDGLVV